MQGAEEEATVAPTWKGSCRRCLRKEVGEGRAFYPPRVARSRRRSSVDPDRLARTSHKNYYLLTDTTLCLVSANRVIGFLLDVMGRLVTLSESLKYR